MTSRTSAAVRMRTSRPPRTRGDRAYAVYAVVMVVAVLIVPLARAVGVGLTSTEGVAMLTSSSAPTVTVLAVTGLWAGALLLGRVRGPALRAPFLSHALASSDISRASSFGGPYLRSSVILITLSTVVAAAVGVSLVIVGHSEPGDAAVFGVAGACVGIVAAVAWLAGQAAPRVAASLAPLLFAVGAITSVIADVRPLTPWGWVGRLYPGADIDAAALLPLATFAVAVALVVPALLRRLTLAGLVAQAVRWESATALAAGMEFADAAAEYRAVPGSGRRWRAVRPAARRARLFLIRDAVGAARTPVRLAVGVLGIAAAGVLLALSLAPAPPNGLLGAAAGVVLFAALGPLTDGIRHAASVASDLPLYGISDGGLLANHALFPLALSVGVLLAAVVIGALLVGQTILPVIVSSIALGACALASRVSSALKGPLPPGLLAPIVTPLGDLGAAFRVVWALDGVLLAALAGASAAVLFSAPAFAAVVGITVTALAIRRWRHRA